MVLKFFNKIDADVPYQSGFLVDMKKLVHKTK